MKNLVFILLATISCHYSVAENISNNDMFNSLSEKCETLENKQSRLESSISQLSRKQKADSQTIQTLSQENEVQRAKIDSLQSVCSQLIDKQTADRENVEGLIGETNENVRANQDALQSRTVWGVVLAIVLVLLLVGIAYYLVKRIKSGNSSIDDVRKAQEALQSAQVKMQEESVKLDDKLLELFDKQMAVAPQVVTNDEPDHSLTLKVADEIVRIEMNMSRMDSSIKGYKQLAKAVERIKDNFKANGYEIVDMLGKPYNEGMKVIANFVADESLAEGAQVITGITKPQINYNGKMIQAAQITVSQNI